MSKSKIRIEGPPPPPTSSRLCANIAGDLYTLLTGRCFAHGKTKQCRFVSFYSSLLRPFFIWGTNVHMLNTGSHISNLNLLFVRIFRNPPPSSSRPRHEDDLRAGEWHWKANTRDTYDSPAASLLLLSAVKIIVLSWEARYKGGTFLYKTSLTGWKWSNLNAPSTETPVSHSLLSDSLFPIFCHSPLPFFLSLG